MAQAEGRMAIKDAHCNDDVLSTMEPTVEPIGGSGQAAQRWPFLLWGGGLPWTALVSPMTPDDALLVAFSELAPDYERTMNRELEQYLGVGYQAFVEGLLDRAAVGPDDWVLDVATGTALIPRRLAVSRDGHGSGRAVGVDITPAMLNGGNRAIRAGNLSATAFLVGGSGMELPFAPQVFDVAVCAFGTHHMDAPRLLRETRRVLRPGGRLVYVTCSILSEENDAQIRAFIQRTEGFALVAPQELIAPLGEAADAFSRAAKLLPEGVLMTPRRTGTDGFFVAMLRRLSAVTGSFGSMASPGPRPLISRIRGEVKSGYVTARSRRGFSAICFSAKA